MGVASHLNIRMDEYDARIRTFVPDYEHMLSLVAGALRLVEVAEPLIVDMGVGTGALAARCLEAQPGARLVGIDSDPDMLKAGEERLKAWPRVRLVRGNFLEMEIPGSDGIVASLALHHILTPGAKRLFYRRCGEALSPGGILVSADCFPARETRLAAEHRDAWLAHLEASYSPAESERYLSAWAEEDVYFPLEAEMDWLGMAGFQPEVLWRKNGFAVIAALRPPAG